MQLVREVSSHVISCDVSNSHVISCDVSDSHVISCDVGILRNLAFESVALRKEIIAFGGVEALLKVGPLSLLH